MIFNPIVQRELIGMLRTRKAMAVQVLLVLMFAALVIFRWPSDPTVDLAGNKSQEVFRLFEKRSRGRWSCCLIRPCRRRLFT